MKNFGSSAGNRAGWTGRPARLQASVYCRSLPVLEMHKRFGGIDPPRSGPKPSRMTCPDGRLPRLYVPLSMRRFIAGVYSWITRELLAFGCGVLESHHT